MQYFIDNVIDGSAQITAKVVNQSFVATDDNGNTIEDPVLDQAYDNYIARFNTIIVSSAGNAGEVGSPSSSFNGNFAKRSTSSTTALAAVQSAASVPPVTSSAAVPPSASSTDQFDPSHHPATKVRPA